MQTDTKRSVKKLKAIHQLPLPSGITADVRRPPLAVWIAKNKLPDHLLTLFAQARRVGGGGAVTVSGAELPGMMDFAIELARESFVWPKIVDQADPEDDDTLEPGQLSMEDLSEFLTWAFGGSKGAAVDTKTGPVSVEALDTFRPDSQLSGAGEGGREVQSEAVGDDGDSRRGDGA
jgi:hypothetical protein